MIKTTNFYERAYQRLGFRNERMGRAYCNRSEYFELNMRKRSVELIGLSSGHKLRIDCVRSAKRKLFRVDLALVKP